MDKGWIKLHRRILENHFLMNDNNAFIVFVKLLHMVGREKGQWTGGRRQFSKLVNVNENTLKHVLDRLETQHLITRDVTNHRYTVITVVNWQRYQSNVTNEVTQTRPRRDPDETTNTRKRSNKKINKKDFVYLRPELDAFIEHRQKLRASLTPNAISLIVRKLDRLYPEDHEKQKECLNQSIEFGWKGVFELKSMVPEKVIF